MNTVGNTGCMCAASRAIPILEWRSRPAAPLPVSSRRFRISSNWASPRSSCCPRQRGARDIPSWLPAPAQGFVELDQREQFIPFSLRQAQLGVEQITVRVQRIEQCIDTAPVAHVG
jgi:hypothetical protein